MTPRQSKDLPLARVSLSGSHQNWTVHHETLTRKPEEVHQFTSFIEAATKLREIVLAEAERQQDAVDGGDTAE